MPSLLWVYGGSLSRDLHRTSRVETAAEMARLGWDVTFVAADVSPDELADGVRADCIPRPSIPFAGNVLFHLLLLRRIARRSGSIDVILCGPASGPFLLPVAVIRRALGWDRPKVVMDWRTVVMNADLSLRGKLRNAFYWVVHCLANSFADGQTAITRRLAEMVGISDQQLLGVWSSGVRLEQFGAAIPERRWPRADEPVRLIYLGVLAAERNLLALCEAVRTVRLEGVGVTLDLVGDGPQRRELESYVAGQADVGISLHPAVGHALVPKVLSGAHVGVLPFPDKPHFRVSSPIKLFEYMAAGMPILATRIVCHTDVLGDEDRVFWAEDESASGLAAAIREVCARGADLETISERMAGAAQAWTWESSARRLNDALLRLGNDVPVRSAMLDTGKR